MKRNSADEQLIRYLTTGKSLRDIEIKGESRSTLSRKFRTLLVVLPPLVLLISRIRPRWKPYMIIDITQIAEILGIKFYLILAIDTSGTPIFAKVTTSHTWKDLVKFLTVIKYELGYTPRLIICDWAKEILFALRIVYPNIPVQRCWAHILIKAKKQGFNTSDDWLKRATYNLISGIYSTFSEYYLDVLKDMKKRGVKLDDELKLNVWGDMCKHFTVKYSELKELLRMAKSREKWSVVKFIENVIQTESNLLAFMKFPFSRPDTQPVEIRFRFIKEKLKDFISRNPKENRKVGEIISRLYMIVDLLVYVKILEQQNKIDDLFKLKEDGLYRSVYKNIDVRSSSDTESFQVTAQEIIEEVSCKEKFKDHASITFKGDNISRRDINGYQQDLMIDYGFNVQVSRACRKDKKRKVKHSYRQLRLR